MTIKAGTTNKQNLLYPFVGNPVFGKHHLWCRVSKNEKTLRSKGVQDMVSAMCLR